MKEKRERKEFLTWIGVLMCLLGTEMLLRLIETRLSVDVAHIRGTPETVRKISEGGREGRTQVLFIGNSSTREGVDPELFDSLCKKIGDDRVDIHYFYPDGGSVGAWRMAWPRYFEGPTPGPDIVLLCGGRSHFRDIPIDPVIAGTYYLSWSQLPAVLQKDYPVFDDKVRLLAAKISIAFANRWRVQRRIRDMILPHNRDVLWNMASPGNVESTTPEPRESSRFLEELLGFLRESEIATAVVAMPNYADYDVPEEQRRMIESNGARFIDLRSPTGIEPAHFYDRAHLGEAGSRIFTKVLFDKFAPMIENLPHQPRAGLDGQM